MPLATQDGDPSLLLEAICTHGQGCAGPQGRGTTRLPPELSGAGASCVPGASPEAPLTEGLQRAVVPEEFCSLVGAREMGCQLETVVRAQRRACLSMPVCQGFHPAGATQRSPVLGLFWLCDPLGFQPEQTSVLLARHLWSDPQRPGQGWPRAHPLFAPHVRRKWLQPGGSQILTMTDGPGALLGYCQGLGGQCPSGCVETELRAAAGRWVLCRIWHF